MTRFQMMRMIWIDAWLERCPDMPLQRQHLCILFDLSVPQISADFKRFQTNYPGRMTYDRAAKCYRAAPGSKAIFDPWQHEAVFGAGRAVAEAMRVAA